MKERMENAAQRLVRLGKRHPRGIGATLSAMGATIAVGSLIRHRRAGQVRFPDPGELAAETATSVHNAVKSAVISFVREREHVALEELLEAARHAMRDALRTGVDVTAVAIGVVEGANSVSHLLPADHSEVLVAAAELVADVAASRGDVAEDRVRDLLRQSLPESTRPA